MRSLKVTPQILFGAAVLLGNGRQLQYDRPVSQVVPLGEGLDSIQDDWPLGLQDHLGPIAVELPHAEGSARCQATQCIAEPDPDAGKVVEIDTPAVLGGDHQVVFVSGSSPKTACCRINHLPQHPGGHGLAGSLLSL